MFLRVRLVYESMRCVLMIHDELKDTSETSTCDSACFCITVSLSAYTAKSLQLIVVVLTLCAHKGGGASQA